MHGTILPVVLYGFKTWYLILREKHRLKVFENRVLRRIFGPKYITTKFALRNISAERRSRLYCGVSLKSRTLREKDKKFQTQFKAFRNGILCSNLNVCHEGLREHMKLILQVSSLRISTFFSQVAKYYITRHLFAFRSKYVARK
jgi:hypothetical protein